MKNSYHSKLIPLLVLAGGLVATYFLQQAALDAARHAQKGDFDYQAHEIVLRIEQRLAAYEQALLGARGLFIASKSVERDEFRDYVAALQMAKQYPGIQGVGFSLVVPSQEKNRHIEAVRKEGFPNYTVRPEGNRDLYTSIVFLEPFADRNLRAFGYDMYSEPVRRAAMEEARDQDKPVLSGKVKLVQETDQNVQAGFLMYVPVYRNGSLHETVENRRANIIGWVYSPFRMNDLMGGILGDQVNNVDLEIYDGESAATDALMYDSASAQKRASISLYEFSQRLTIAGHNWHIQLHSLPALEANIDTGRATVIWQAGITMSLLLALLAWQLVSGRARALNLAEKMTSELRTSEAASRAIIEAIPVPLALNDEQGNISYLNRTFVQTIGYTLDEIPTLNEWWPRAYPDPQYRKWIADNWQQNMEKAKRSNEPFTPMELNIRCKSGEVRTFLVGAAAIGESFDGNHLVILYDITERKHAEKELWDKNQLLDSIIENIPNMIFLKRASDLRFELFNRAGEALVGHRREELLGRNDYDFFPKEQADFFIEKDRATLEQHGVVDIPEESIKTPRGIRILHTRKLTLRNALGEPQYLLGISEDITERKTMQTQIANQLAFTESVINAEVDALAVCHGIAESPYVRFTIWNPSMEALTGYGMEEINRLGWYQTLYTDTEVQEQAQQRMERMRQGEHLYGEEWTITRKNGERRIVQIHTVTVADDDQGVHVLAVLRDITERKEYEEELKRSNAELEQFSYAVSHDMRQPLRMISSYLQLLERSLANQLDGEKRDYFNFAIEGAKRIDQMLVALLEYSRVGRKGEPPTWIESSALLDEALQFLRPAITEAQAKVNIAGEWPRIFASHDEILRLIQNLVGNAAKYHIAGRAPEITVTGEVIKNEWRLCVADNGVGIIPDQIKRLFKVFQRLQSREAYEGTGVGLALCRKIAEHHKGRIWAESAGEGKGSQFYVVLPVLRGER